MAESRPTASGHSQVTPTKTRTKIVSGLALAKQWNFG